MKKMGLLILSVILATTTLTGCGGKKEGTPTNTEKQTNTQNDEKGATTTEPKTDTTKTPVVTTPAPTKVQASTKPTPTLDQLLKEEKEYDKTKSVTVSFQKTHPSSALVIYVSRNYDLVKYAFNKNVYTKVSDSTIVFHVLFMDLADNSKQENRDIKLELKNGEWTMTSDELAKK